jgi:hypothetical protein
MPQSRKKTTVPPTLEPTPLSVLKANREITCYGPSGNVYTIRPVNLERHALAGGLPAKLRSLAMQGAQALDKAIGWDDENDEDEIVSPETRAERDAEKREVLDYLDKIVRTIIVAPDLDGEDLDVLPPVDYRWALQVAMGESDEDGEGRRLWGREPLSRWATFREFHGCDEDCDHCRAVREFFSLALVSAGTVQGA